MMLCPRTVLGKEVAEPVRLASECQARERGSTRHLCDYRRVCRSQSRCPINRQGFGIKGLSVLWRSETQSTNLKHDLPALPRLKCAPRHPVIVITENRAGSSQQERWRRGTLSYKSLWMAKLRCGSVCNTSRDKNLWKHKS